MTAPRCDRTQAWGALRGHFEAHGRELDLREAFARDPARFEHFSLQAPEVFADLSKNRWDLATQRFVVGDHRRYHDLDNGGDQDETERQCVTA